MWRLGVVSFVLIGVAQAEPPATFETIAAETRVYAELPGPYPGTTRPLTIWRPPSAPPGPLPTLYMADGPRGLYVAAAHVRAAIEAGRMAPIQIIGVPTESERRQAEYVHVGTRQYEAHARWWLETVIPWAEANVGAASQGRVIGGFSNGGDFALAMGATHPDVFAGVLAHSPVTPNRIDWSTDAARVRWAVSAGRREFAGDAADNLRRVRNEASQVGASARLCLGFWGHNLDAWIEVSPGAIAWLFGAENHAELATPREIEACQIRAGR